MKGMQISRNAANFNHFQFGSKEIDLATGFTDFGARLYSAAEGRFFSIDPLTELSRRFSPFIYGNNNPLRYIDPDGMMASEVGADGLTTEQWVSARGNTDEEQEARDMNKRKDKDKKKDEEKKKEKLQTVEQATSNGLNPNGDGIEVDYTLDGAYIGGKILKPFTNLLGQAWGGLFGKTVGKWITTNESMSVAAAEYQSFITGRAANESYLLNGVKFDGVIKNVLIDAKSGYGNFVNKATGQFQGWFKG
jgi:RHS repeat-associated protein